MNYPRALDFPWSASVPTLLGIAVTTGAAAGLGLAAYTTAGGLQERLHDDVRPIIELVGNPYAAEPDLPAGAQGYEGSPPYAIRCKGCGPSLQERLSARRFNTEYEDRTPAEHDLYGDLTQDEVDAALRDEAPAEPADSAAADPQIEAAAPHPPAPGTVAIIQRDGLIRLEDIQAYP